MKHTTPLPSTPLTGTDPAAAPLHPASTSDSKPRRCTADYRWTQPKVIAFLAALAMCGKVTIAARAVGMSRTSAYRLRARMASARFDAAFENARRSGIRARAAASQERLATAPRSKWAGASLAELIARERAVSQDHSSPAQGDSSARHGDAQPAQGDAARPQGDASARKVTP